MFCSKCGKELIADASFCPNCGFNLTQTNVSGEKSFNSPQPVIVNVVNNNKNDNVLNAGSAYPYKSKWSTFFICLFLGELGIHRFYVGKTGTGILWLFTLGLFGIGWIIDLLLILFGAFRDKAGYPLK